MYRCSGEVNSHTKCKDTPPKQSRTLPEPGNFSCLRANTEIDRRARASHIPNLVIPITASWYQSLEEGLGKSAYLHQTVVRRAPLLSRASKRESPELMARCPRPARESHPYVLGRAAKLDFAVV